MFATVQGVQGGLLLAAWSILFGPDRATWLNEKVVPDRLNEACSSASTTGSLHTGSTEVQKPSTSWQVEWRRQTMQPLVEECIAHNEVPQHDMKLVDRIPC